RAWALLAQAAADPSAGGEATSEAIRLAEALGDAWLLVSAHERKVQEATAARRFQEACDWAEHALAASPKLANPGYESYAYWNAGFVYLRAGRFPAAQRVAAHFDQLASSLTPHDEVHAVGLHAVVGSVLGDWRGLGGLALRAEAATTANADFPCQFNWRTLLM